MPDPVDILVIGGGINGTGIARDAVGRGFSVLLAEMHDFASGTSSAATKLVHGGLRYLEHYEFRLVQEALAEREVLWAMAPHIIWPLRFVLPHHSGLRPAFVLRTGLFLYDYLGGRKLLPPTRNVDLRTDPAGKALKGQFRRGFEYSDCWVDDARMVVLNARDAADRGADLRTRTKVTGARRAEGLWEVDLLDANTNETETVRARLLVNAAGPWVDTVLAQAMGHNAARNVRLVKGSHIVVKKQFPGEHCFIFQNADGRIIFAIPYEGDFTLIGTTDQDFQGDPRDVRISEAEIDYLCASASEYLAKPVTRDEIVWSYSGVRPLYNDNATAAQEATRDYVLKTEGDRESGALINVFGGKLTTYRRLAESVMERVEGVLGKRKPAWTRGATLPGGSFPPLGFEAELSRLRVAYPALRGDLLRRLMRHYGTISRTILGDAKSDQDLGPMLVGDLSAREVDYLMDREWAQTADDVLFRRSKLAITAKPAEIEALRTYMEQRVARRETA